LTSFGTKALVDFGSAHVVTYGAFFGFIEFFCDISGDYAISGEKVFCVISGFSLLEITFWQLLIFLFTQKIELYI